MVEAEIWWEFDKGDKYMCCRCGARLSVGILDWNEDDGFEDKEEVDNV